VAWVRRRSSAFSRGRSRFRGVSGQAGRWEARIGTFAGRKNVRPQPRRGARACGGRRQRLPARPRVAPRDARARARQVSFGIWETEERAARQYDRALIVEKGRSAKTNFPLATYEAEVAQFEAALRERRAPAAPRLPASATDREAAGRSMDMQPGARREPAGAAPGARACIVDLLLLCPRQAVPEDGQALAAGGEQRCCPPSQPRPPGACSSTPRRLGLRTAPPSR